MSLGKSEEWFWNTELRIVHNLLEENRKLKKIEQKNQAIYTAMYVWGKNPDEYEEKDENEPVAGRDVPIDPNRLRGFFI